MVIGMRKMKDKDQNLEKEILVELTLDLYNSKSAVNGEEKKLLFTEVQEIDINYRINAQFWYLNDSLFYILLLSKNELLFLELKNKKMSTTFHLKRVTKVLLRESSSCLQ